MNNSSLINKSNTLYLTSGTQYLGGEANKIPQAPGHRIQPGDRVMYLGQQWEVESIWFSGALTLTTDNPREGGLDFTLVEPTKLYLVEYLARV